MRTTHPVRCQVSALVITASLACPPVLLAEPQVLVSTPSRPVLETGGTPGQNVVILSVEEESALRERVDARFAELGVARIDPRRLDHLLEAKGWTRVLTPSDPIATGECPRAPSPTGVAVAALVQATQSSTFACAAGGP